MSRNDNLTYICNLHVSFFISVMSFASSTDAYHDMSKVSRHKTDDFISYFS